MVNVSARRSDQHQNRQNGHSEPGKCNDRKRHVIPSPGFEYAYNVRCGPADRYGGIPDPWGQTGSGTPVDGGAFTGGHHQRHAVIGALRHQVGHRLQSLRGGKCCNLPVGR